MKNKPLKIGNRVRILNSRPVVRVGYSTSVDDFELEVEKDPDVQNFITSQKLDRRSESRVIRAVAASRMARTKRSGVRRKLIFGEEIEGICGREFSILSRRVAKTGTYEAACGGINYEGDYDYDPAFLNVEKTHILVDMQIGGRVVTFTSEQVEVIDGE